MDSSFYNNIIRPANNQISQWYNELPQLTGQAQGQATYPSSYYNQTPYSYPTDQASSLGNLYNMMGQQSQMLNSIIGVLGQLVGGGVNPMQYGVGSDSLGSLAGLLSSANTGSSSSLATALQSLLNGNTDGTSSATSTTKAGNFLINNVTNNPDDFDLSDAVSKFTDRITSDDDDNGSSYTAAKFTKSAGDLIASGTLSSTQRNNMISFLTDSDVSSKLDVASILTRSDVVKKLSANQVNKASDNLSKLGLVSGTDNAVNTTEIGALVSGVNSTTTKVKNMSRQTLSKSYKALFTDTAPTGMTTAQTATFNAKRDTLINTMKTIGFKFNTDNTVNTTTTPPWTLTDYQTAAAS